MVDCIVRMPSGGVVCRTEQRANVFLEDTRVSGAVAVRSGGPRIPASDSWTHIRRYSCARDHGVNLINGRATTDEIADWTRATSVPSFEALRNRHYRRTPSFEDEDAVNVKSYGAKGDQVTDDTEAFRKAIAASDKVFVPKGKYKLLGTLHLGRKTQLFGLASAFCSIGDAGPSQKLWQRIAGNKTFKIVTDEGADATPALSFLSVRGRVDWRAGGGSCMLAPSLLTVSASGGGRFYGVMARGGPLILEGVRQPASFYALNVERKGTNPQSLIRNCANIRVYFFKVEAGTINRANAGDANTPCRIADSKNIRVYCMYGVVRKLQDRPMLEVVNSRDVVVAQLKTFSPGRFPHLVELHGSGKYELPSSRTCALDVLIRGRKARKSCPPSYVAGWSLVSGTIPEWIEWVAQPLSAKELKALRVGAQRGRPRKQPPKDPRPLCFQELPGIPESSFDERGTSETDSETPDNRCGQPHSFRRPTMSFVPDRVSSSTTATTIGLAVLSNRS